MQYPGNEFEVNCKGEGIFPGLKFSIVYNGIQGKQVISLPLYWISPFLNDKF